MKEPIPFSTNLMLNITSKSHGKEAVTDVHHSPPSEFEHTSAQLGSHCSSLQWKFIRVENALKKMVQAQNGPLIHWPLSISRVSLCEARIET